MPLAEAANLVVDGVENPKGMPRPILMGHFLGHDLLTGIGDEESGKALYGLKSKIVVDAAIAQSSPRCIGWMAQNLRRP